MLRGGQDSFGSTAIFPADPGRDGTGEQTSLAYRSWWTRLSGAPLTHRDRENVYQRVEWTWQKAKTHGPAIAGQLVMQAVIGRSHALAMDAVTSQMTTVVAENAALQGAVAAAGAIKSQMATLVAENAALQAAAAAKAASGGAAVLGGKLVQGMGAGSSYWILERTWPVVKEAAVLAGKMALGG